MEPISQGTPPLIIMFTTKMTVIGFVKSLHSNETWGLYHKTHYAVIYGFHNKLECLSINIRLGWKGLTGTNTLA
jgi:hypothetical protein